MTENIAGTSGGAIYSWALTNSTVTIATDISTSSTLSNNEATANHGGAVYSSAVTKATTIFIQDTTLNNNIAGLSGGAIYNNINVQSSTVSNIEATVTIDNVVMQDNTATSGKGGAIYNLASNIYNKTEQQYSNLEVTATANVNISESSLIQNKAAGDGAGVYNYAYVKAHANVATPGKVNQEGSQEDRYVNAYAKANVNVLNSTIARNTITTDGAGAGIYNYSLSEAKNNGRKYETYWDNYYGTWETRLAYPSGLNKAR